MKFTIDSSGNKAILQLDGDLTVEHAAEIKDVLVQSLDTDSDVDIQLNDVTAVDLSCLQLLCSAHRTAIEKGKKLRLNPGNSELFIQTAQDAGYNRQRGCSLERDQRCLWETER